MRVRVRVRVRVLMRVVRVRVPVVLVALAVLVLVRMPRKEMALPWHLSTTLAREIEEVLQRFLRSQEDAHETRWIARAWQPSSSLDRLKTTRTQSREASPPLQSRLVTSRLPFLAIFWTLLRHTTAAVAGPPPVVARMIQRPQ